MQEFVPLTLSRKSEERHKHKRGLCSASHCPLSPALWVQLNHTCSTSVFSSGKRTLQNEIKCPMYCTLQSRFIAVVIIRIISGCIYYVRRLLGTSYFYIIQSSKSFEEDTLLFPFPRWRNRGMEAVQQLVQQTQLEEQVAGCEPGLSASRAQVLLSVWTLHISLIHILASEPTSTLTFWCNTELTRRIISWHHIDIYSCFEHSSVTKWHS